ncbi:MAG: phage portal protein [Streptomyces sp.]|nr:phage portal protein [Streptomyces sp.]NUS11294.1 phage portal protein [Streptomyces sp.]NUS23431.1 phage portal protein [Streptomyces sp.]
MGLRNRIGKAFGNRAAPPEVQAAEEAAGMGPTAPFSPGQPLNPYDGYSRHPRSQDYQTGYNIAARPKQNERVSFDTLRGLVEAYDVAQMCIWHRIDSIRALDWSLVPARGFSGDADEAINLGMQVLAKPDRQRLFPAWLATWLYDLLAFDAGALYRLRNRGGRAIGLRVVDGTTIAPLLDYWGGSPEAPAPAYVQYAQGLPWNQLTRNDLIYEPFRPRSSSPYGTAPLESIMLNANTDLRFQAYFLQRFTEGNIPAAFASAPETWTPQQIEEFQGYWDAFLMGDQKIKSQIRWMPGGGKIEWSNEKDFDDSFSLFLMRKTCAAYHIVPSDLGFTETVNRSSGETQADVQHRVGDLPLVSHIEGVLTGFLQHDMGLPVEFTFDTGQEKEDRLALAQAWQIYIDSGMASPDEGREELLGLPSDPQTPTPRFYNTTQGGPVPLLSINGLGGKIDPETFAPAEDQPIPAQPAVPAAGVIAAAGTTDAAAVDAAQDAYQGSVRQAAAVTKEGAAPAAADGITADTGLHGYDLDDGDDDAAELTKAELSAFRSFRKARRRTGIWRDFEFRHVDARTGRRLNQAGRATLRKDAGEIACAGLAVQALDTGRVLMLQRALDDDDPAGGTWEFPGGHLEGEESAVAAAAREWSEETGLILPFNPDALAALAFGTGRGWTSGIYAGFVYPVASESVLDLGRRDQVSNPDDPDGDIIEAVAWWDPEQLVGNPAVRPELTAALHEVLNALNAAPEYPEHGTETVCPCGMPAVFDAMDGWQHADGSHGHDDDTSVAERLGFAKAAHPKGEGADGVSARWPGWRMDLKAVAHWIPRITDALRGAVNARSLAEAWLALNPRSTASRKVDRQWELTQQAIKWLEKNGPDLEGALTGVLGGVYTDGYLIGLLAAENVTAAAATGIDWGAWTPGDTNAARLLLGSLGDGAGLDAMLRDSGITIRSIAANRIKALGLALARGAEYGDSPTAIAAAIEGLLSNPSRAEMIATTELNRAVSRASLGSYIRNGIESVEWISAGDGRVCNICADNVEGGPRRPGSFFPSGVTAPPGHPWCRCALVPVIGGP